MPLEVLKSHLHIDAFPGQGNNSNDLHLPVGCTLLYLEVPR